MQLDVSNAVEHLPDASEPLRDSPIAALSSPIANDEPCGPDLDLAGDADYLNFFAQIEGILPTSFFSPDDGKPFDPSSIDAAGQLAALDELLARSRDIRLLTLRARIFILNRDITGFATTIAAIADLLSDCWDDVHPRPLDHGDARTAAVGSLTLPTVVFPLQYSPLFEGRRTGTITYRAWLIATGEIKPREGEAPASATSISEAMATADPGDLDAVRRTLALLTESLDRIHASFDSHGQSVELGPLRVLAGKMRLFVDPQAADAAPSSPSELDDNKSYGPGDTTLLGAASITSLQTAKQALVAIAEYYAVSEPSSPTLPLVRQAYVLIGKSFVEIVNVLVPSQVDKAAFQIGTDQVFDLPLSRLATAPPSISSVQDFGHPSDGIASSTEETRFRITKRAEALSLLDAVQRYFKLSEPSSPVPMLCERGRALAEKDFMSVLENVLPKSALKSLSDK